MCVWDTYREKLAAYVSHMREHYPGVPLPQVITAERQQAVMEASVDAFEALERQLAAKKQ